MEKDEEKIKNSILLGMSTAICLALAIIMLFSTSKMIKAAGCFFAIAARICGIIGLYEGYAARDMHIQDGKRLTGMILASLGLIPIITFLATGVLTWIIYIYAD